MADLDLTAKVSAALNCIDLSNSDIDQSAGLLKQACLDSGFFYVINHGICEELMNEVFDQSKKFFGLPLNEKMKLVMKEKQRGYQPPSQLVIDQKTNQKDRIEAYRMGVEVSEDDTPAGKLFYGPNVWPPTDVLPRWKETMQRYHQEILDVGRAIGRVIALALDLNVDFFNQPEMLGKAVANFYTFHYGVQDTVLTREILGAPAHTDFNFITILAADVLGLQICKDKYAKPQVWEYVPPLKGALIVNIGDMLERLSNDIFRSTLHRVVFRQERYSIALFLYPSHDCIIECLPTCKSKENPPKYASMLWEEFVNFRTQQVYAELENNKET